MSNDISKLLEKAREVSVKLGFKVPSEEEQRKLIEIGDKAYKLGVETTIRLLEELKPSNTDELRTIFAYVIKGIIESSPLKPIEAYGIILSLMMTLHTDTYAVPKAITTIYPQLSKIVSSELFKIMQVS